MLRRVLRRSALVAGVPLLMVGLPTPAQAVTSPNTMVVDVSSDSIAPDGHCSLREAVMNAVGNNRFHSSIGECPAGRADAEDVIRWGFTSPFSSLGAPLPTITGPDPLTLAGEPGISDPNPIISGGGSVRLVTVDGGDLTLEKVTLAGAAGGTGSALDLVSGQVHLVQANIAANNGSGAVIRTAAGTTLVAESTTFVNNTVLGGGTVIDAQGTLTINDGILTLTQGGGGISADGATVSLTDVEVSDNGGRGLSFTGGSTATLTRVDLIRNASTANCGGLASEDSTLTWTGGEVFGNTSAGDGGGVCLLSSTGAGSSRLSRVSITNNHAPSGKGGGVVVRTADVQLGNATISQNTAADAAALLLEPVGVHPAGALLANATVSENINEALGGTATVVVGADSALTTGNTIIGGNQPADITTLGNATVIHSNGIVGVDVSGIISTLAPNGGIPEYFTHALLPTASLALDTGSPVTCALPIVGGVDARGLTRPADACDIGAVERDVTAPTISGAALAVATGRSLSGANLIGRVSWGGSDAGIGVNRYRIQRKIDGGAWSTLTFSPGTSVLPTLVLGKTYTFRVRAEDYDGNVSPWSTTSAYGARLIQESSTSVAWTGLWTTASSSAVSGGTVRYSTKLGASATLTAKARGYAWVATTSPTRGKAKIYVDGVLKATVDLSSLNLTYRAQVWSTTFATSKTRTVKVVVLATSGRPRIDVDAFALLT